MKSRWTMGAAGLLVAVSALAQPYGMGGMMGGYGPGGGGPGGMMGGMMGGWGMGPGMMGGPAYGDWLLDRLDLSADQRSKIVDIQKDLSGKQWDLMRRMHDQGWPAMRGGAFDEQAARAAYAAMAETHRQMFELSLDARKRIDAVLTPQQREQLARPRGRP